MSSDLDNARARSMRSSGANLKKIDKNFRLSLDPAFNDNEKTVEGISTFDQINNRSEGETFAFDISQVAKNALKYFKGKINNNAVEIFTPIPKRHSIKSIDLPSEMREFVDKYIKEKELYSHQIEFIQKCFSGENSNFIITTGTGSGKSLCFWFWVFYHLLKDDTSTALVCFPTQALLAGQADKLSSMSLPETRITYRDSSTTYAGSIKLGNYAIPWTIWHGIVGDKIMDMHQKEDAFLKARIRISTVDKAHWSLIRGKKEFLSHLKCLVLDEAHIYHGVFGSNIHYFLKRIYMSKEIMGKDRPAIFLASATLSSAEQFAETLLSLEENDKIIHIKDNIKPDIKLLPISEVPAILSKPFTPGQLRIIMLINCSNLTENELPLKCPEGLIAKFMKGDYNLGNKVNSIYFSQSKSHSRKLKKYIGDTESKRSVIIYDADMTSKHRRETERILNENSTKGVTILGTSALELGVDIKGLDLCFMEQIPMGRAEMFQRIGRVGRRSDYPGLIIMKLTSSPNDQNLLDNLETEFQPGQTRVMSIPTHLDIIKLRHAIAALDEWWSEIKCGNCDPIKFDELFLKHFNENPQPEDLKTRFKERYGDLIDTSYNLWFYKDFRPSSVEGTISVNRNNIGIANINRKDLLRFAHPGAIYFDHNAKRYRVIDYIMDHANNNKITYNYAPNYAEVRRSIKEVQVQPENKEIRTNSVYKDKLLFERKMDFSISPNYPRKGSLRFGIWKYTRSWEGYYEYEDANPLKGWEKNSRFVPSNKISDELSNKFSNFYSYRTMGWEWNYDSTEVDINILKLTGDIIGDILKQFFSNAVESEMNDIEVHLGLSEKTLRVIDSNPGGNGLSEALLFNRCIEKAFYDCEKILSKYLDIGMEKNFERYIRNIGHQSQGISVKEILDLIYVFHENWLGEDSEILNKIGNYLLKIKNYEKSIVYFDKAIKLRCISHSAWSNKGKALYALSRFEESMACFNEAIKISPEDWRAWNNIGNVFLKLSKDKEALNAYDKSIELDPKHVLAWINKGTYLYSKGVYEEALRCYEAAIEIDPNRIDALQGIKKIREKFDSERVCSDVKYPKTEKMTSSIVVRSKEYNESNSPPRLLRLNPDKFSPQEAGAIIMWSAIASDPDGDLIYYKFWLKAPSHDSWMDLTGWITDNTWIWKTDSSNIGNNKIKIQIRDNYHAAPESYDKQIIVGYNILANKREILSNNMKENNA